MRILIIYILLAASLLLTVSMSLMGGVLVLTIVYGRTYLYSPFWLLPAQLFMAAGFLMQRQIGAAMALGASWGLAFCLALELYTYLKIIPLLTAPVTVWFLAAHIGVFTSLGSVAAISFGYFKE